MTSQTCLVALLTFALGNFTGAALLLLHLLFTATQPVPVEAQPIADELNSFPGPIYDEWGNPTLRHIDEFSQADYERIKAEWKKSHGLHHATYLPAWDNDTDLE